MRSFITEQQLRDEVRADRESVDMREVRLQERHWIQMASTGGPVMLECDEDGELLGGPDEDATEVPGLPDMATIYDLSGWPAGIETWADLDFVMPTLEEVQALEKELLACEQDALQALGLAS